MLSNPGTLEINDMRFVFSSTDVVHTIDQVLYTKNILDSDRVNIIANLIVKQRHLFPVDPAVGGSFVEPTLYDALTFTQDKKDKTDKGDRGDRETGMPLFDVLVTKSRSGQMVSSGKGDNRMFVQVPPFASNAKADGSVPYCVDLFVSPPPNTDSKLLTKGAAAESLSKAVLKRIRVDSCSAVPVKAT
eukprot:Platyproteum_vivax@DN4854_c0_g1_i1.p1